MARVARAFQSAVGIVPALQGVLDARAQPPPCPITNHMGKIAMVPRLVVGKDSRVEGLCECAGEVYFTCLQDLEEMAKKWLKMSGTLLRTHGCIVQPVHPPETSHSPSLP